MERIQEALAKARAQRQQGSTTRTQHAATPGPSQPVDESWAALAPFKLNRAALKRNRVVASEPGRDAAPYDLLRTKIIHQAQTNGWRRVAIVSPDMGAGKSTTLANLAFSFDLRRPALHKVLAQKPDHSMAELLDGHLRFSEHGLRLGERVGFGLNNGPASNPSELLLSRAAREALDGIEQDSSADLP